METFGVQEVAQEILSIWGEDAERICSRKAQDAESEGDQVQAAGWRRIRHAVNSLRVQREHYGQQAVR